MKNHGKVRSTVRPQEIEITDKAVFIASNITPYTEVIDDYEISGFEYLCTEYTKDEYLIRQAEQLTSLQQELQAAKILLGVE